MKTVEEAGDFTPEQMEFVRQKLAMRKLTEGQLMATKADVARVEEKVDRLLARLDQMERHRIDLRYADAGLRSPEEVVPPTSG